VPEIYASLFALIAACAHLGCASTLIGMVKLSTQLKAVARHVRILTRRLEAQTGVPLPQLDAEALDELPAREEEDTVSFIPSPLAWDVPERREPMRADRESRR
jgi:hypothetical protein